MLLVFSSFCFFFFLWAACASRSVADFMFNNPFCRAQSGICAFCRFFFHDWISISICFGTNQTKAALIFCSLLSFVRVARPQCCVKSCHKNRARAPSPHTQMLADNKQDVIRNKLPRVNCTHRRRWALAAAHCIALSLATHAGQTATTHNL